MIPVGKFPALGYNKCEYVFWSYFSGNNECEPNRTKIEAQKREQRIVSVGLWNEEEEAVCVDTFWIRSEENWSDLLSGREKPNQWTPWRHTVIQISSFRYLVIRFVLIREPIIPTKFSWFKTGTRSAAEILLLQMYSRPHIRNAGSI